MHNHSPHALGMEEISKVAQCVEEGASEYIPKAGLAGGVAAGVVGCVLALLTGLTRHMPLNAMGAIVLAGVSGLLNFSESSFLWRVRRPTPSLFS